MAKFKKEERLRNKCSTHTCVGGRYDSVGKVSAKLRRIVIRFYADAAASDQRCRWRLNKLVNSLKRREVFFWSEEDLVQVLQQVLSARKYKRTQSAKTI